MTQNQCYPIGGFDWLDTKASLRRWFASWLVMVWRNIYWDSVCQLRKGDFDRLRDFEETLKLLGPELGKLSTARQLAVLDAEARKFKFQTTRERVEFELRYFLKRAGKPRSVFAAQGRH